MASKVSLITILSHTHHRSLPSVTQHCLLHLMSSRACPTSVLLFVGPEAQQSHHVPLFVIRAVAPPPPPSVHAAEGRALGKAAAGCWGGGVSGEEGVEPEGGSEGCRCPGSRWPCCGPNLDTGLAVAQ